MDTVNLLLLNYISKPGSGSAHQPNNQVSHNIKNESGKKSGNQIHQLAYQKYSGTASIGAMGRR
jgi:hypothetical protein